MKNDLRSILYKIDSIEQIGTNKSTIHVGVKLLVTILFLFCMLSCKLEHIGQLLLYFIYPILGSALASVSYWHLFKNSLFVLPFVLFIGIFNLLLNQTIQFYIYDIPITQGFIQFFAIIIRGLLSVQSVILLIETSGFYNICRSMQRITFIALFVNLLLFIYRYIYVIVQESLSITMACRSRGYGKRSFSMKIYATIVLQLLIKSFDKSDQIHKAMLSRGYNGTIKADIFSRIPKWKLNDILYMVCWSIFILGLRIL